MDEDQEKGEDRRKGGRRGVPNRRVDKRPDPDRRQGDRRT